MANTDDDTVIYLDPKRSESMSLCISYGDTSAGYGSFKEIENDLKDAMRFLAVTKIRSGRSITAFPVTPYFNSSKLNVFQPWAEKAEKVLSKAVEADLINNDYKARTINHGTIMKVLMGEDYSMFENLREYSNFRCLVEMFTFIGFVATQRIYDFLIQQPFLPEVPSSFDFIKIKHRAQIDRGFGGIKVQVQKSKAQEAADCLVKLHGFYQLCSADLEQILNEVSILTSLPTQFPRKDAPKIPDDAKERQIFLLNKLNNNEVYRELDNGEKLVLNDGGGLRLYSLNSRHHFLGFETKLPRFISIGGQDRLDWLPLPSVQNYLDRAKEVLESHDYADLKRKYGELKDHYSDKFKEWKERFETLDELYTAYAFINDAVHSIGYLENPSDSTWQDVTADLLGKVMDLPGKINWLEQGLVQELESFYHLKELGHDIGFPPQSQPIQDQPSNDLATRLASAIKRVSKASGRNGCNLKDVATVLFGEKNGRPSDSLKKHFVKTFDDTRYARPTATKKVDGEDKKQDWPHYNKNTRKGKSSTSTSIKYQEFIKLWPEADRQHVEWETKDPDIEDSPVTILKIEQLKPKLERYANYKKIADWLVENFDEEWLEEELAKFEQA